MSDTPMNNGAPGTQPAPAAQNEPTAKPYGFTSKPIEVKPAEPVKSAETKPEAAKVEPAKDDAATLASALAKASAGERAAKQAVAAMEAKLADLEKKLGESHAGSAKAEALQKEIDEMLARPRKYLNRYKPKGDAGAFDEILRGFAEDEPEEDPRIAAIEAKLNERDKADAEVKRLAEEAKAKETEETTAKEREAANESGRKFVADLIKAENEKSTSDSVARFALIGDDVGAVERARVEVIAYAEKEKIELTPEVAQELVLQALDQMEANERKEIEAKAAKLRTGTLSSVLGNRSFSQNQQKTVAETRPATSIANFRSAPLPPATNGTSGEKPYGWTNRAPRN